MMTTTNATEPHVDRLLSLRQVAQALGFSLTTCRKLVDDGRLKPVRIVPGGRLRFRERDVQALIDKAAK